MTDFDEWKSLFSEYVRIKIRVDTFNDILIPNIEGKNYVTFKFKKMTCEDHWMIEEYCKNETEDSLRKDSRGLPVKIEYIDYQDFKKEIICRMLKGLSFYKLRFKKNKVLTRKSKEYLLNLPAPLIQAAFEEYEKSYRISDEEEETITKQAVILFSKSSQGVENACEAVSLYCNLKSFYEKFGLTRFSIKKLPYKEYMKLKMMISKENQSISQKASAAANKNKSSINVGGRMRKSNATIIPDTGQKF